MLIGGGVISASRLNSLATIPSRVASFFRGYGDSIGVRKEPIASADDSSERSRSPCLRVIRPAVGLALVGVVPDLLILGLHADPDPYRCFSCRLWRDGEPLDPISCVETKDPPILGVVRPMDER
jgi:hypothetical protein